MAQNPTQINDGNVNSNDSEQEYQILVLEPQQGLPVEKEQQKTVSVRLNDYYVVISQAEAALEFGHEQDWSGFLCNQFLQRESGMSVIGLNSLISILHSDHKRREQVWTSVMKQLKISQNQYDQCVEIQPAVMKQIQNFVGSLLKKMEVKQNQQQIRTALYYIISKYQSKQLHLGSLKGLQYISYALYQCSPVQNEEYIFHVFKYVMDIQNIKQIFYPGYPLLYSEIQILCQTLKSQAPKLYQYLISLNIVWEQIFISYYRSLLMNKVKNILIMSKILDLILVYGISIIRMILVRIMSEREQELLQQPDPQKLTQVLGTKLVYLHLQAELERQIKQQQEPKKQNQNMEQNKLVQILSQQQIVVKLFRKLIIGI